jgi:SAM-dependent methyltransferase
VSDPSGVAHLDAVRQAYDTVAADYAELLRDELASNAIDRSVLGAFAELVIADGAGLVADLGCGPGRVAAHLDALGLEVMGIDLSPAMVAEARLAHPHLRFEVGSLTNLELDDEVLAGAVAWYSIIHTPPERRADVYGELARVIRTGGHLLVAFQVGDERVHLQRAYGHDLSLVVYRLAPDTVIDQLTGGGFELVARTIREPLGREAQQQAFLLLRRCDG